MFSSFKESVKGTRRVTIDEIPMPELSHEATSNLPNMPQSTLKEKKRPLIMPLEPRNVRMPSNIHLAFSSNALLLNTSVTSNVASISSKPSMAFENTTRHYKVCSDFT
ncbi:unnamed protein product [Rotaria sordida]|uniref:Uncharacterized protein n=1 Tax=Rotaria sordida TaxID=392033 RepID=A0A813NVK5_9BILA|nr:unnamed protein product [Rotaria sordida]CAF1516812.1 unnamed protein product [Rotaria sordida]